MERVQNLASDLPVVRRGAKASMERLEKREVKLIELKLKVQLLDVTSGVAGYLRKRLDAKIGSPIWPRRTLSQSCLP